jgi:hypothetical protein
VQNPVRNGEPSGREAFFSLGLGTLDGTRVELGESGGRGWPRMTSKRSIRFEFDDFGRSMLEVAARRTGTTVGDLLCQAAHRCVDGTSRSVPKLRRLLPGRASGEVAATLELPPSEWQALEAEAERQHVSVEHLLEHATLHLLVDLDGSAGATSA